MNLRIDSAAGFQGGAFDAGYASARSEHYGKPDAAAKAFASDETPAPPSPKRVGSVSDKSVDQYPKLVGPEAPASLLFEASLAASANNNANSDRQSAHINFPRMINRRWVPSPMEIQLIEITNKSNS